MVALGVVFGQLDVLVHVERHDMLEPALISPHPHYSQLRTHESLPALTSRMRCLYVGIGDEPVGRPRTNGFSGVGLKSFILSPPISLASFHGGSTWLHMSTYRLAM